MGNSVNDMVNRIKASLFLLSIIICTPILSQNYRDSIGLKQGLWIEKRQNGTVFYKTYKNDTLNGLYYREHKTILEERGQYKKGLKDSIWLKFNRSGNLIEKKRIKKD